MTTGAAGFVHSGSTETTARVRVELNSAQEQRLFGFSLSPSEFRLARQVHQAREEISVEVAVRASGSLPVVTGRLLGEDDTAEILIVAHLCHPRPGANDNAAGVAGSLELAHHLSMLRASRGLRCSIRWLWTAEMVGSAAFLAMAGSGATSWPQPLSVICLDVIGRASENSCLIVEEGLPVTPSVLISSVTEAACLASAGPARSYSGARLLPVRTWALVPFAGASDHVVFADRSCGASVVQLGHWPDPLRHSSLDTPDTVSTAEVQRVMSIVGGALGFCFAGPGPSDEALNMVLRKHVTRRIETLTGGSANSAGWADHVLREFALHRPYVDERLFPLFGDERWRAGLQDWTCAQAADALHWISPGPPDPVLAVSTARSVVVRRWEGPFNLRALSEADERRLSGLLTSLGTGGYSAAVALALAIDNRRSVEDVILEARTISGLAVPSPWALDLLDLMRIAGWLELQDTAPISTP